MTDHICPWANRSTLELEYHNTHWGFPLHDDSLLFEMLILETMQAGLSWTTILAKRQGMTEAFDSFDPTIIQGYSEEKLAQLLLDERVIRNKLKLKSVVANAKSFLAIQEEFGSFNDFIWNYVDFTPIQSNFKLIEEVPGFTPLAETIAKNLKNKGFKFVGPTTVYAFMQSIGMVNDHLTTCPIHQKVLESYSK